MKFVVVCLVFVDDQGHILTRQYFDMLECKCTPKNLVSLCSVTGAFMVLVPEKYKCRQFLNPILSK